MIADIFVVLIVTLFVYLGYRSGFMKTFIKIASYLISIVISFFLYPVLSNFLLKTPIYTKIVDFLSEKYISNGLLETGTGDVFGIIFKYLPGSLETATTNITQSLAALILNIFAFIVILILSKLIIRIVGNVLGIFTKLPVIRQFNRLGGSVLGGIVGVLMLYIISAVIILFAPFTSDSKIITEIEGSTFASEIYQNNIIVNFLK